MHLCKVTPPAQSPTCPGYLCVVSPLLVQVTSVSLGQDQTTVPQRAEATVAEFPWQVVCGGASKLLFLIGFNTVLRQHSQPTPSLLGRGCMRL